MLEAELYSKKSKIAAPVEDLFNWHSNSCAFKRLVPPWENVEVIEAASNGIKTGSQIKIKTNVLGPIAFDWHIEHRDYIENKNFSDYKLAGSVPFSYWKHDHVFDSAESNDSSYLKDSIEYKLPFGFLGKVFMKPFVEEKLEKMFSYRHTITSNDLKQHLNVRVKMKILVTGATGLVGEELVNFLSSGGHEVKMLSRSHQGEDFINWDPANQEINLEDLEGFDSIVHLAGENIAAKRWSEEQKRKIKESRVKGTSFIADAISRLKSPPKSFVVASAIGFYGNRGDEILTEESGSGTGFLAETCVEWENASKSLESHGIRVVNLRFGVILSPKGGALAKLLLPFQLGAGGIIGNGKQYMSWIALDDVIGAIYHSVANESVKGAVNVVSPNACTNYDFTKVLGRVLFRPTIAPLPGFAAKIILGEMADELLLASARVEPQKLLNTGYEFLYADLESALRHLLGK